MTRRPFTPGEHVRVPVQVAPGETRLVPGIVSEQQPRDPRQVEVVVRLRFGEEEAGVFAGWFGRREVRRGWGEG